jgi:hypothetical protein
MFISLRVKSPVNYSLIWFRNLLDSACLLYGICHGIHIDILKFNEEHQEAIIEADEKMLAGLSAMTSFQGQSVAIQVIEAKKHLFLIQTPNSGFENF